MLSLGVDLEGVVNDSYGFLSDLDSGTAPRRKPTSVQIQSWNERSDPRPRGNVTDWKNRFDDSPRPGGQAYDERKERPRLRQQEAVMPDSPSDRFGYNSGPSTLWKRTNESPSRSFQQSRGEPERQKQFNSSERQHINGAYSPSKYSQQPYDQRRGYTQERSAFRDEKLGGSMGNLRQNPVERRYDDKPSANGWGLHNVSQRNAQRDERQVMPGSRSNYVKDESPKLFERQTEPNRRPNYARDESPRHIERQTEYDRRPKLIVPDQNSRFAGNSGRQQEDRTVVYARPILRETSSQSHDWRDQRLKEVQKVNPAPKAAESPSNEGSFLLQRTNTYLDAINSLKNRRDGSSSRDDEGVTRFDSGSIPVDPPKVPDDVIYQPLKKVGAPNKVNQRMSRNISEANSNRSSIPPPKAPPMPPPMPPDDIETVFDSSPVKKAPMAGKMAPPPWLEDLKKRRKELRRVPSLKRTELEPEPEPKTFKEKLERIYQRRLAEERWHPAKASAKRGEDAAEPEEVVVGTTPYKTVKTLSKTAMMNKLEKILVKGPPNRPSFKGAFDMDDKRKEAVARLRAIEKEALEKQRSTEEVDDFDDFPNDSAMKPSVVPSAAKGDEPVVTRQRMLMGDVMATIKLKGARNSSSFT